MRKLILTVGVLTIALATALIWSRTSLGTSQATPGETVGLSQRAAISPSDMMVHRAGPALPVQRFDAH
jgi:hypothetical protein